ncbi:MAG: DUF4340 domain-containing protein [Candidatus Omnitrophota bacterium]
MKRNLVLLVIAAVIALLYFWDVKRQEQKKELEEKDKEIIALKQDEVKEISIVNKEGTFKAVMDGENWRMVQPFETGGDKSAWDNIARSITDGQKQRVIDENPKDIGVFGLKEPTLQVTVSGVNGATASTLLFGKATPTSGKYYALVKGSSEVVTVYSSMYTSGDKKLFDLRDKTIVDIDAAKVQRFEVDQPGLKLKADRKGEDEWTITEPVLARADSTKIQDMLSKIKNGKIKQFIDEHPDNLAAYELVQPATRLVFWTGEKANESSWSSRALLIGCTSTTDNVYAMREGQKNVFAIDPKDLDKVPYDVLSLRMKKISSLRSWDIKNVKVSAASETIFEATKSSGDWYLLPKEEGGKLAKAEYSPMMDFVREAVDLEIAQFLDDATKTADLSQPVLTIELKTDAKSETIALAGPKPSSDGISYYFGMRKEPDEVYALNQDKVEKIIQMAHSVKAEETPTPTPEPEKKAESTPKKE